MDIFSRGSSSLQVKERRDTFRIVEDAFVMGLVFVDVTISKKERKTKRENRKPNEIYQMILFRNIPLKL